jgi:tetratricopeptide (TPR) repeat protein
MAFYKLHNISMSLSAVKEAIKYNPNNLKAYNLRGDIRYELKDYEEAIKNYERAMLLDPNNHHAKIGKQLSEIDLIELRKKRSMDIPIKLPEVNTASISKDTVISYTLEGDEYYQQQEYDDALKIYNQALEIDPNYRQALLGKARTYLKMEQYTEANKIYQKIQGPKRVAVMMPYSAGFRESKQRDFFKW